MPLKSVMIDKLKNILKKIINFKRKQPVNSQDQKLQNGGFTLPSSESSISAKKKHDLIVLLSLGVTVIIGLLFMQYRSKDSSNAGRDIDSKASLLYALIKLSGSCSSGKNKNFKTTLSFKLGSAFIIARHAAALPA